MRSVDLVSREWCDLVFEGRNRQYGAYRLRKEAGRRYARALWGVCLCLLLLVGGGIGINVYISLSTKRELAQLLEELKRMEEAHKRDSHLLKFVDLRPKTETVAKAVVETAPEIVEVPEIKVMQEIVPEEELSEEEATDTITTLATETDSIMEDLAPEPPPLATLTPTEVVEEMPQFPGGINALMLWLDKNIVYPPLVIQQKVSGTTYLTFLVDEAGNVIEPKIEEALHPMISATIMRAARNMPKWEPGKTNGKVTIVRVTIPIEYHL